MKKHVCLTFVLVIALSASLFGQYVSHYTEKDRIKADTLLDKISGSKFIVDKNRIYITALDTSGKLLWETDPVKDNKIERYRTDRPTIVYFALDKEGTEDDKEVIWISYSNTQFGYLDKQNGKFTYRGQD